MSHPNDVTRVLLIADDREGGDRYRDALAAVGYEVIQAASYVEALDRLPDPDLVVLCDLAMFAYPAQNAQLLRVPAQMTPAELIVQVHRRVALRAALHASMALAA